ncbi:MAG: type I methionyl aminopeptidase [Lentisphaerae bacterium]|nr:type I methionyl aminopeptidase [Lentisphaerota bacterium]
MIPVKSAAELERMRASGRLAAEVLRAVLREVSPGVTTEELAGFAGEMIRRAGARSAFLGYRGFPGEICVSVNETVVHGLPGKRRIALGDIVSIDVGVTLDGYIGDTADTVMVGVTDHRVARLVATAHEALAAGIACACAGRRLSDVSHAIEVTTRNAGFSVVREFVGHGIGRRMHEDPQIPNFGPPGKGPRLKPGMTLAIEPMINMGEADVEVQADGWTVLTRDRRPSAHAEHTIAVTAEGPEIMTRADEFS